MVQIFDNQLSVKSSSRTLDIQLYLGLKSKKEEQALQSQTRFRDDRVRVYSDCFMLRV